MIQNPGLTWQLKNVKIFSEEKESFSMTIESIRMFNYSDSALM